MPNTQHGSQFECSNVIVMPHILVVSQPDIPGLAAPLPSTTVEAASVAWNFPNNVTHLTQEQATIGAVLDAMEHCGWVHLACHGVQDTSSDPTKSAFFLHDGRLELSQLMNTSL
jgi:CHAT domain-containing protein